MKAMYFAATYKNGDDPFDQIVECIANICCQRYEAEGLEENTPVPRYAQKGWKILDTHLGSGSSAIAAHDMGYEFHGYELDTEYFEGASKRLKEHQRQLQLF